MSRTTWRAKPCGWRSRERVVALGEEFGPAGPMVLDVLEELAKEQRGDYGEVRTGLRSLARDAFLPRGSEGVGLARKIVNFAASIRALDDLSIADGFDNTVVCRVSGFAQDQGRGYESVRKSMLRADSPENGDNEPTCPEPRDSVPVGPPTGQDRTENGTVAPSATVVELFGYWQQRCRHPNAKLTPDRRRKIGARLREGFTPQQIRRAIDGAARAAFVSDDGRRFDDIELICRTGAKLESFIDRAGDQQTDEDFVEKFNAAHARLTGGKS